MKDFFDGTFWRWFGIGFLLASIFVLLNAVFKFIRHFGSFILFIGIVVYAINRC